jgi:hypothetical protein
MPIMFKGKPVDEGALFKGKRIKDGKAVIFDRDGMYCDRKGNATPGRHFTRDNGYEVDWESVEII